MYVRSFWDEFEVAVVGSVGSKEVEVYFVDAEGNVVIGRRSRSDWLGESLRVGEVEGCREVCRSFVEGEFRGFVGV